MTQQRHDIYGPIHKGLRLAHADLLTRIGRADFYWPQPALLADLRAHLALAAKHLAHEEIHIHPALEARRAGGIATLERQHNAHRETFARLEDRIAAAEQRLPDAGRALYLAFVRFVAEDFEHMHQEETVTWPLLCALFTDDELLEIEMTIIGSLTPEDNIAFMRLMIPAMNPAERAGLLGGMQASAPPEAFAAVYEQAVCATLNTEEVADLARMGIAA